jgi:hypothetical protein
MGQWLSAIGEYSVEQIGQSEARGDPRVANTAQIITHRA